jgi:hypothetical protein
MLFVIKWQEILYLYYPAYYDIKQLKAILTLCLSSGLKQVKL